MQRKAKQDTDDHQNQLRLLQLECKHGNLWYVERMIQDQDVDPLESFQLTNASALVTSIEYDHLDITKAIVSFMKDRREPYHKDLLLKKIEEALLLCCIHDRQNHAELLWNWKGEDFALMGGTSNFFEASAASGSLEMMNFWLETLDSFDWVLVCIISAREGQSVAVRRLVNCLQHTKPKEWASLTDQDRFLLHCIAGEIDPAMEFLLPPRNRNFLGNQDRINMAFALALCCGHENLAMKLLEVLVVGTSSTSAGSVPCLDVSVEDNLAARAASVLNLPTALDSILAHPTYRPSQTGPSLHSQYIKLVDLDILDNILRENEGVPIKRCQDICESVFVDSTQCSSVWFISHRWMSPDHPEVDSQTGLSTHQLMFVVRFLKDHREKYCSCFRLRHQCKEHKNKAAQLEKIGLFYDYLSLPQKPRSKEEDIIFKNGLHEMDTVATFANFLALSPTTEFREDFLSRGWCFVEVCLALDFGGDLKFAYFLNQNETEDSSSSSSSSSSSNINISSSSTIFASEAIASTRDIKKSRIAHSEHIEGLFQAGSFVCTNHDDYVILARILQQYLKKIKIAKFRADQRRLLRHQYEEMEKSIHRRQEAISKLSFDEKLNFVKCSCACLSSAILRTVPGDNNYEKREILEEATTTLSSQVKEDFVESFQQQITNLSEIIDSIYENVFSPLYTLAVQESEDAFEDQVRQLKQKVNDDDYKVRDLVLALCPDLALVKMSLLLWAERHQTKT